MKVCLTDTIKAIWHRSFNQRVYQVICTSTVRMKNKAKYGSDLTKLASTDTPSDNYELNYNPGEKSEVVVSTNHLDVSEKLYLERRVTEKLKGKNNERKYYSNNNSIIELQQVDDKRYVTCKTRVIPNSE